MNNLIEERDDRTRKRKKKKKKMDSIIGLGLIRDGDEIKNTLTMSASVSDLSDKSIRLLDEGYCDQGFVLKKGTLKKFLDGENQYVCGYEMDDNGEWQKGEVLNLTDDFKGTVNVGHQEFATYPIIVGEWRRKDLALVDIGNERNGLDVALHINEDLNVVQDLKAMPYDIGVSAEFYYHINDEDTHALFEALGEYIPVIDEIFIFAYGLVGECGNVNSSGLELKGATMSEELKKKELMAEEVDIEVETEGTEEAIEKLDEIEEEVAELSADDDTEAEAEDEESSDEEVSEDASEEEEEPADEEEAEDEESKEDEIEEADEEGDKDEVEDAELSYAELLDRFKTLTEEVERLKDIEARYTTLKKNHRRVNRKLAEEKEAKAEFLAKTKELSAELFENEGAAEKEEEEEAMKLAKERKYYKGDGIAD